MNRKDIRKQYNNFSGTFSHNQIEKNQVNREVMYNFIPNDLSGKKVLDLACGDGVDANYYRELGGEVTGLDASEEMIELARNKYPDVDFKIGFAEDLPYQDEEFDCVFSKYAIMTSADMKPIFNEVHRVLKPGGEFIYLVTHPFRQYMERKDLSDNYFNQIEVQCNILDSTVTVVEPTHTMNDYLNTDFLSRFELVDYIEAFDPAAEQVHDGKYPGFFVLKAKKK